MTSLLDQATDTLEAIHAHADEHDQVVIDRAFKAAAERGATSEEGVADVLVDAYIPIDPLNGRIVHTLALARPAGRIVEFGTSVGAGTIYLASALSSDEPPVITTEIEQTKIDLAAKHLDAVDLLDRVELRHGDAFETLADLDEPVSLLLLDGWKPLYLPLLKLLEPLLVQGALVVADDTILFADRCAPLLDYLRTSEAYQSVEIAIGDGMEIAIFNRPNH